MDFESGLFEEFLKIAKSGMSPAGVPFQWDERARSLKLNPKSLLVTSVVTALVTASTIGRIAEDCFKHTFNNEPINKSKLGFEILVGIGFFAMAYFSSKVYRQPEVMERFITQLAKLELTWTTTPPTYPEGRRRKRLNALACRAIHLSSIKILPWLAGILAMAIPRFPTNLAGGFPARAGVVLATTLNSSGWPPLGWLLEKAYLLGWNWLGWHSVGQWWTIFVTLLALGSEGLSFFVLGAHRMFHFANLNQIQIAFQRIQLPSRNFDKLVFSHLVTVTHIALGSVGPPFFIFGARRSASLAELDATLMTFRQIQLLSRQFDKLVSNHLVTVLVACIIGEVICVLNLMAEDNAAVQVCLLVILVNTPVGVVLMFGFCGELHHTSKKCMSKLNSELGGMHPSGGKRRYWKRAMRSIPIAKVHFGSMNFVEKTTPVVFQQYTSARIVDDLLLDSGGWRSF